MSVEGDKKKKTRQGVQRSKRDHSFTTNLALKKKKEEQMEEAEE